MKFWKLQTKLLKFPRTINEAVSYMQKESLFVAPGECVQVQVKKPECLLK